VMLFERSLDRPFAFVASSTVVVVAVAVLMNKLEARSPNLRVGMLSAFDIASLTVLCAVGVLHMIFYFRRGMVRWPLLGAATVSTIGAVALTFMADNDDGMMGRVLIFFAMCILAALVGSLYAGVGVVFALIGGWARTREEAARERSMSRQDLLERYFELQQRFRQSAGERPRAWFEDSLPAQYFRRHPWASIFVPGLALTAIAMLLSFSDMPSVRAVIPSTGQVVFALMKVVVTMASFVQSAFIGLFSGSVGKAIRNVFLLNLVSYAATFLPIGIFGPAWALKTENIVLAAFSAALAMVLAGFAGLGAEVLQRNLRERSLENNDTATILSEMLRIQWRLQDQLREVCVMVVDAAKSSQMKADADPLEVEYSFREYQDWLRKIAESHNGSVISTAGDGAVCSFTNCPDALRAAQRVQTDLPRFNRDQNRLTTPFRLRIGLHAGEVAANLNEVEFTAVIDIAAHVQDVAPIGGIAVSESVLRHFEEDEFLPIAKVVDGQRVFLAINPTDDAV